MRWLVDLEDDVGRSESLRSGSALLEAAANEAVVDFVDEDQFALELLRLYRRDLLQLDYELLETDQGQEVFEGQPAFHLRRVRGLQVLPEGRAWVAEPHAGTTFNISDSTIGQLAGRDIHNATVVAFIEALERVVDQTAASEVAKREAKGFLAGLRRAAGRVGEGVAEGTGTEVLVKALSHTLGLPLG